jgi:hypothetical protein
MHTDPEMFITNFRTEKQEKGLGVTHGRALA